MWRNEIIESENVHFCNSVFENNFSTGTSNFLHQATVILSTATWRIVSEWGDHKRRVTQGVTRVKNSLVARVTPNAGTSVASPGVQIVDFTVRRNRFSKTGSTRSKCEENGGHTLFPKRSLSLPHDPPSEV